MALAPLAAAADLSARDVDVTDTAKITLALSVSSAAVRDAAEAAISEVTGTVIVPAPSGSTLTLPGLVRDVTAVLINGSAVTDYETIGNGLWRRYGWGCGPVPVSITGTFGLPEVAADIVDLTCKLTIAWLNDTAEGGASVAGLKSVRLDDAAEAYTDEAAGQVSSVFIPEATRNWLRSRFGGGVAVVDAS